MLKTYTVPAASSLLVRFGPLPSGTLVDWFQIENDAADPLDCAYGTGRGGVDVPLGERFPATGTLSARSVLVPVGHRFRVAGYFSVVIFNSNPTTETGTVFVRTLAQSHNAEGRR